MGRLSEATAAQKIERDRGAHAEWGQRLTVAQFLEREQRLRAHPWSRAAMTTWLWSDERGRVVASCESFASPSRLGQAPGVSHAIASVLTDPDVRGRGHATAMMDALVAELPRREPRSHAVTLYSDVGSSLYARSGFVPLPADDLLLAPAPGDPAEGVDALLPDAGGCPLPDDGTESFVVLPGEDQRDWCLERERIYAALLAQTAPAVHGARCGDSRAFWVANFKTSRLLVMLVAGDDPVALGAVVRSARRVAHALSLPGVEVWLDDSPVSSRLAALPGAQRRPRDGSLAMLCPLVPGLAPASWRVRPRALWV